MLIRACVTERWPQQSPGVPLAGSDSPWRSVTDPSPCSCSNRWATGRTRPTARAHDRGAGHHQRPLVDQGLARLRGLLAGRRRITVELFPVVPGKA